MSLRSTRCTPRCTRCWRPWAAASTRCSICPHSPDEGCDCRKPKPGLFLQIGERYGVDLANVPTAGDSLRDLLAGAAAGCEPHLLLTGMGQACRGVPLPPEYPPNTRVHEDLAAFVDFLLEREARAALKVAV